jgi:hypothetical protein
MIFFSEAIRHTKCSKKMIQCNGIQTITDNFLLVKENQKYIGNTYFEFLREEY